MDLISYPRVIYIQATEPADKTQGLLWVDSDDNKLYISNGTSYLSAGQSVSYSLTDDIILSHDAEVSTTSSSLVKLKTITLSLPETTTIRIKCAVKAVGGAGDAQCRVYKNGAAVSAIHYAVGENSYEAFSDELEYADGDTLELYAARAGTATCYVKEFRVTGQYILDPAMTGVNT